MGRDTVYKSVDDFTMSMLLTPVFNWAYENDLTLYRNLDKHFDAFKSRSMWSCEEDQMRSILKNTEFNPLDFLTRAVNKADYNDTLRFRWTFTYDRSVNKGEADYEWKYGNMKEHPYTALIPLIDERMKYLKDNNLDDWHKSEDHDKHDHFRYWINNFLTEDKLFSMRLFVENDTKALDTLYIGTNQYQEFNEILKYILENNICPDPHHKELIVSDFANPDIYNPRKINSSGQFGGFWYLVYLTSTELREVYKTKIKKNRLSERDKAVWAYINAHKHEDYPTKFYVFIT
jgi:hypothetical protein